MIKRIRIATRRPEVPAPAFPDAWARAAALVAGAGDGARPVRVAVDVSLPGYAGAPRCDGVGLEWFTDADHLGRFDAWQVRAAGRRATEALGAVLDLDRSPVAVADEHVVRGADWLAAHGDDGAVRFKHLALARRAEGLGPEEFSARWRVHAGTAGGVVIPEAVRGRAYVQNHPRPSGTRAPGRGAAGFAWDALAEVHVDGEAGLRARAEWFRDNVDDGAVADLVGEHWFLAVEEVVVVGRARHEACR